MASAIGAAQRDVAAGRLHHGVRLGGQRDRRGEPAAEELRVEPIVQGDRQHGQRPGPAGELDLARGELVPRHVVAERTGDVAGQPQPAQLLLLGDRLLPERAQRFLQRGRARGVALGGDRASPSSSRSHARAPQGLPVGGEDRGGDLARVAAAHQAIGRERRRERIQIRAAARASTSSGSSRLAASSSSGGASRPRVVANVICACNSCARALSSSSSGPACAIASSRSAVAGRAGLVLACAATSARRARRAGSGVSSAARSSSNSGIVERDGEGLQTRAQLAPGERGRDARIETAAQVRANRHVRLEDAAGRRRAARPPFLDVVGLASSLRGLERAASSPGGWSDGRPAG